MRCNSGAQASTDSEGTQSRSPHIKCISCRSEDKKDEELLRRQSERLEKAINKIKESKLGRAGTVYKMKDEIAGHKKTKQEATAVCDPKTGELIVSKEKIKEVTLEYVIANLKGNEPDEEVKQMVELRRAIQLDKMNDNTGETFMLHEDDFERVLMKFKSKPTKTYDFLLKAGDKYKEAMFKLCKTMIETEEFPLSFRKTTLYMIWKRKGAMDILKNNRFLHMKGVLARTVYALIVDQMKEPLISSATIYQIGGLPGHSINEHLFTQKTIMAWAEMKKKVIIFLP